MGSGFKEEGRRAEGRYFASRLGKEKGFSSRHKGGPRKRNATILGKGKREARRAFKSIFRIRGRERL